MATAVMTSLDTKSRAASRGMSDIRIRNLFIIPTILFLIVFNIFPLIYSLGYSFTDFRASGNAPANFQEKQHAQKQTKREQKHRKSVIHVLELRESCRGSGVEGRGEVLFIICRHLFASHACN